MKKKFKQLFLNDKLEIISSFLIFGAAILHLRSTNIIVLILIVSLIFIASFLYKYYTIDNKNSSYIEHRFCFELIDTMSKGLYLEEAYFIACMVLKKYEYELYTLDEIRMNNELIEKYGLTKYYEVIISLFNENDFYRLTSGKYSLFCRRIKEEEKDYRSLNRFNMVYSYIVFGIALFLAVFNILLTLFNLTINESVIMICAASIILIILIGKEIYEKIHVKAI